MLNRLTLLLVLAILAGPCLPGQLAFAQIGPNRQKDLAEMRGRANALATARSKTFDMEESEV